MNLEKLKETARKFEQKEDWRKAIDVYLKAIHQVEEGAETAPDLSLYNRIGDLYLKVSDITAAVRSYERAVDLYADQGFFNNAIALCGKILRVNPARTQTYLKLAQLHARKNVVIEAKRNLIEFLERMNALGQLEPAFQSVKAFADQFAGSQEIRMMLVELLRAASREDEAREQLEKLASELEAVGDTAGARRTRERLQAIGETELEPPPVSASPRIGDLVFLDTGPGSATPTTPAAGLIPTAEPELSPMSSLSPMLDGLETTATPPLDIGDVRAGLGAELDEPIVFEPEPLAIERAEPAAVDFDGARLDGLEGTSFDLPDEIELTISEEESDVERMDMAATLDTVPTVELELDAVETPVLPETDLTFLDAGVSDDAEVLSLEERVLDDPENPDLHRDLADALFTADQPDRALEELELALAGYEAREVWREANGIVDRFLAVYPDSIRHHQKRVELAYRAGERSPLIAAYVALGDVLARMGATEKAIAVFRRVEEHDPGNVHAATALAVLVQEPVLSPPPPIPAPPAVPGASSSAEPVAPPPARKQSASASTDFVDFGAMVLDPQGPADSRMRIDRSEPTGENEQREFQEILEQFKRGIDANLDDEDYEAHYDLGVAFKEMGLLDEAIAEFQKSVRSPSAEGRLRASEALGVAFCEKGQYAIAESVLRRALDATGGNDEAKIGLVYWLGRALEAQGKNVDAIATYERALALDIRFMDVGERIGRLSAGRRA